MPSTATVLGDAFSFGYSPATAPTGLTGFVARTGDFRREPKVYATATDGNGAAEAVQVSDPASRNISATYIGYALATLTLAVCKTAVNSGFITDTIDGSAKKFVIKSIRISRKKGDFVEITVEAEYFPHVTIP